MNYSEITVSTTSQAAELVAYFLQEVCMDGVSVYDKADLYNNSSWDYKDDSADLQYGAEVLVKGYCELNQTDSVLAYLKQSLANVQDGGSLTVSVRTVDGDAWVQKWKDTFQPIYTDKLVICPEWQSVDTDKIVFNMDTGIAFGTGQHQTTAMCLQFAEELDLTGARVLDVGCGSGILGLCALLLGAQSAELVDVDSQATDVAVHNAQINGLADRCTVKTGNLTDQTDGKFNVVFANLTADILALLHKDISSVVQSGTIVVLSGILDVKEKQVEELYSDLFTVVDRKAQGEWRALLLRTK